MSVLREGRRDATRVLFGRRDASDRHGCVGSKPPSKEPADSRACSVLLTKEDAAAALGEAVQKGPQDQRWQKGPSSCGVNGIGDSLGEPESDTAERRERRHIK